MKELKPVIFRSETLSNEMVRTEEKSRDIIQHWNDKDIVIHRENSGIYKKALRNLCYCKLSDEVIVKAIDTYKEIFESDYFYDYAHKLDRFIALSIQNFTDEGQIAKGYKKYVESAKKKQENIQHGKIKLEGYSEVIKSLKELPYDEYLETEHWKHFKNEAIKFYSKCCICDAKEDLHVHHKTYVNRGRETFNDICVMCKTCHKKHHGK